MPEVEKRDFILAVSVLGGVIALLLVLTVGLYVWNIILTRRINALKAFDVFKLRRPKLLPDIRESHQDRGSDNPVYAEDLTNTKSDYNPYSQRSRGTFDDSNFTFNNLSQQQTNSFNNPRALERDRDNRYF